MSTNESKPERPRGSSGDTKRARGASQNSVASGKSNATARTGVTFSEVSPLILGKETKPKSFLMTPTFWVLCYVLGLLTSGYAMVVPSLWPYFSSLGGAKSDLGYVTSIFSWGQFAGSLVLGRMADRLPAKFVLNVAFAFAFFGSFMYGLAPAMGSQPNNWKYIFVARAIWGVAAGAAPVMFACCGRATPPGPVRLQAIGTINTCGAVGYIVGPALAALFTIHGFEWSIGHAPFNKMTNPGYFSSLCVVGAAVLVNWVCDLPPPPPVVTKAKTKSDEAAYRAAIISALPYIAGHSLINYTVFTNLSIGEAISAALVKDYFHWGITPNSFFWLGLTVIGVIVYVCVLKYGKKIYSMTIVMVCLPLIVVGLIFQINYGHMRGKDPHDEKLWAFVPVWQYVLGNGIGATELSCIVSSNVASLAMVVNPICVGLALGIQTAAGSAARAISPIWGVWVYIHWGPSIGNLMIMVLVLISCGVGAWLWVADKKILAAIIAARMAAAKQVSVNEGEPPRPASRASRTSAGSRRTLGERAITPTSIQRSTPTPMFVPVFNSTDVEALLATEEMDEVEEVDGEASLPLYGNPREHLGEGDVESQQFVRDESETGD